jgi:hypothetical protein
MKNQTGADRKMQLITRRKLVSAILATILIAVNGRTFAAESETKYTVTVGAPTTTVNFSIVIKNMQYCVRWDSDPESFVAGYRVSDKIWKILRIKDDKAVWDDPDDAEKNALTALYNSVKDQKATVTVDNGSPCFIGKAGYLAANGASIGSLTGNKIFVPMPATPQCEIVIGSYKAGTRQTLYVQRANSFYELVKEESNKEKVMVNMFDWLKMTKEQRATATNGKTSEALALLLGETLRNADSTPMADLYGNADTWYQRTYLKKAFTEGPNAEGQNVYAEKLFYESGKDYNPARYSAIQKKSDTLADKANGEALSNAALAYLTKGVEYYREKSQENNKVYNKSRSFKAVMTGSGSATGNPIPYCRDGIDTPETFWYKMGLQAEARDSQTTLPEKRTLFKNSIEYENYVRTSFIPGDRIYAKDNGTVRNAGVDSYGFLTGCISAAGLGESIGWVEGSALKVPGKELMDYENNIKNFLNDDLKKLDSPNSSYHADRQFTNASLEKVSMYVPDLSMLLKGDILTCTVKGRDVVGVITNVPEVSKDDFGTNQSTALNAVEFVWVSTTKVEKTNWKDFSAAQNPKNVVFRRLLKYDITSKAVYACADWNVLDDMPYAASITVGNMNEQDQKSTDRWRWIPNTGQYLVLKDITMQVFNKAGLKLPCTEANGYTVRLKGAYDRNYEFGTIYPNNALSFEVAMLDENENVKSSYTLGTPKIANGKRKYTYDGATMASLKIMPGDEVNYAGAKARIGIRPVDAANAYPGDDLLLIFTVEFNKQLVEFPVADGDYVAVYDKKLLWRANLYLDQPEELLNNKDWNEVHPWNAPPAKNEVVASGTNPVWWNSDWGCNEWNRVYDGSQKKNKLADLDAGNGGQVVTFPEFTPLRTIPAGNEASPTSANHIQGTVAYSYPDFPDPPKEELAGDAGSMDSPFDFVWKMMQSKTALGTKYNLLGNIKNLGIEPSWNRTTTPQNLWNNYQRGTSTSQSFIPGLGLYYYVRHKNKDLTNDETGLPNTDDTNWSWNYTFEAGTDCIGFAQRAASYTDDPYKWANLRAEIMDEGETDYKTVMGKKPENNRKYPRETTYGNSIIHNRKEMLEDKEIEDSEKAAYFNTKEDSIAALSAADKMVLLERLKKVVPGDIWMKESKSFPGKWDGHIAIVASIPTDASITDPIAYMDQMILIEGEYTNKIQSVIKKLSVGDYNHDNLTEGKTIYPSFTLDKDQDEFSLNCKTWAIRRLK